MSNVDDLRFRRVSWEEYGAALDLLHDRLGEILAETDLAVDAVVPVLRGGAVAGAYFAYRLQLLTVLPVQYKYLEGRLRRITSLSSTMLPATSRPTLLVTENNHCSGETAAAVIADLRAAAPDATIIYAAVFMDVSNRTVEGADRVVHGRLTNEMNGMPEHEAQALGITPELVLFPWESPAEERAMVLREPFPYHGVPDHLRSTDS